jgi:hypothetical protein
MGPFFPLLNFIPTLVHDIHLRFFCCLMIPGIIQIYLWLISLLILVTLNITCVLNSLCSCRKSWLQLPIRWMRAHKMIRLRDPRRIQLTATRALHQPPRRRPCSVRRPQSHRVSTPAHASPLPNVPPAPTFLVPRASAPASSFQPQLVSATTSRVADSLAEH